MHIEKTAPADIPSLIWGDRSDKAYIFVHGKFSRKEEAGSFADIAADRGYQVLSFDLPRHGQRADEKYDCTIQNGVHDLCAIYDFAASRWNSLSLSACSLGAYFSLSAYQNLRFDKALFLSPILDMEKLIRTMMTFSGVTEEMLKEKGVIPTDFGEDLSWDYYSYVKDHPVRRWESPTHILRGSKDTMTDWDTVQKFSHDFSADIETVENGEHYFHTNEQLARLRAWREKMI